MPTYKTPGVVIEEISKFPPSVAAVETAIPAFIGFTENDTDTDGNSLVNTAVRITSLLEFEQIFGGARIQVFNVDVTQTATDTTVAYNGSAPVLPAFYLYYSMQLYFANGGGPCYIITVGDYGTFPPGNFTTAFTGAIGALEGYDEPTILVFPDACLGTDGQLGDIVDAALTHCQKMQDRFTIVDVRDAVVGGTDTNADVTTAFRGEVASDLDLVKYGAAYFPYLRTSLPFYTTDANIIVKSHTGGTASIAADTAISDASVKDSETAVYNAVKAFVSNAAVTLPPSGGVAGVYARTDRTRGVWKAPANASLLNVSAPAIQITNDLNDGLNIDATSGKSVNAIRAFTGKGTLVWGARTLAGNDNENRYVPVRRFLIFAEESIKKAAGQFVFEPNDSGTWIKVRAMIENFLVLQWRDGALQGAKPEDAFYVSVGLNKTMSAQDILDGYMIVEIGLAIVRPAEFIVLRFSQLMAKS